MTNVLPQYTGLTVNAINYRYTVTKKPEDSLVVGVQNLHTNGQGYVFRSQDDWTARPGNTITKTVPVNNVLVGLWGPGELTVNGIGLVTEPFVSYLYKYDTCKQTPVTDTSCPNYKPPSNLPNSLYDIPEVQEQKHLTYREDLETLEFNRNFLLTNSQEPKKKAPVGKNTHALATAQAALLFSQLEAQNNIPEFKAYAITLPGRDYPETIKYVDRVLPDNRNSQRLNLSQQRLHNAIVESQYNRKEQK